MNPALAVLALAVMAAVPLVTMVVQAVPVPVVVVALRQPVVVVASFCQMLEATGQKESGAPCLST
jgi:hypothetical protein